MQMLRFRHVYASGTPVETNIPGEESMCCGSPATDVQVHAHMLDDMAYAQRAVVRLAEEDRSVDPADPTRFDSSATASCPQQPLSPSRLPVLWHCSGSQTTEKRGYPLWQGCCEAGKHAAAAASRPTRSQALMLEQAIP